MQRLLLDTLHEWKRRPRRKPLLIDGARQTGKTWLLQNLFGQSFPSVLRVDFLENPDMADAFAESLSPESVIANIELLSGQPFNPVSDLLILDEIGECPRALTSLKYFAEQAPEWFIAASGSNVGLLNNFPVGKVEQHCLRPLNFYEFLLASDETALVRAYRNQQNSAAVHTRLSDRLTDYYYTGGMPEAVAAWYEESDEGLLARTERVRQIQNDLLAGYRRDFGKYAGKADAQLIESVFDAIPAQLSAVRDDSVKRFRFKGVYERKSRYTDFATAIGWLHRCRLALQNFPVEGLPRSPLAAYRKENRVKLFLFDVGLLNGMLGTGYHEIKQQAFEYKGYIAENYVQQELAARGLEPTESWQDQRAEIEFLLSNDAGQIVPVEVKSGSRTRAKSLMSYVQKCQPARTLKLTGTRGSPATENHHIVLPLYYAGHVPEYL